MKLQNENALVCFQCEHDSLAVVSFSAIPGSLSTFSQKYLTLALLFFSLFFLFVSSTGRHSFILHAADHSSSSLSSFLPCPHLPFFLTSACSSPVPLSSLCTAVECMWVLVGLPASTASQIPGLAALHPDYCTHATHHHSQKGGGKKVQYLKKPSGCAIWRAYVAEKINMETVKNCICTLDCAWLMVSFVFDEERKKLRRQQMLKYFNLLYKHHFRAAWVRRWKD